MATNVNRIELVGNLGNEPEVRFTATGTLIATASIAVHASFKQGETWQERTDWFRLVAFGAAAEHLSCFGKGERISVMGRLQSSAYTDREGQQRTRVEVVVLRSESAPLLRREPTASEALEVVAEPAEEPPVAEEAPVVVLATPTPRRRRKVATA